MDTVLDTLDEGRHSFLEISLFPDLLKSSNPSLSAIYAAYEPFRESFYERLSFFVSRIIIGRLPDGY